MTVTSLTLNNGVTMPALGFGVFQTPPDETADAVRTALETGYRHIDTAAAYANETGVGEAIRRSGIPRQELFIETKVWVSDYGHEETLHAFTKATRKLGVEQLDLLILHQPVPHRWEKVIAAYTALERLLADGSVRAIGVSNFMRHHLDNLAARTEIVPAVNQIELHPYFSQPDVQAANAERGTLTQAFYRGVGDMKNVLADEIVGAIARAHRKTPAQVMLRWHIQEGRSAIPKSVNPARIAENFDIFDFELSPAELGQIDALDTGVRGGPDPDGPDREIFDREVPER
jgi:diketogulonate reductase-like aldo/keto reductase